MKEIGLFRANVVVLKTVDRTVLYPERTVKVNETSSKWDLGSIS